MRTGSARHLQGRPDWYIEQMRSVFFVRPEAAELDQRLVGFGAWVGVWLPAAIACGVIACESTEAMGAAHTSAWLRPIFESVLGRLSDPTWELVHHLLRKTGHFVGYGAVCLTFLRGWLLTLARKARLKTWAWHLRSSWLAVLSTFVVASCDEIHQAFVPGRTGTPWDVLLDTCGAVVVCAALWLLFWRKPDEQARARRRLLRRRAQV